MEHLSLLAGGQEHTREEWERAAAAVLRKAGRLREDDPDSAVWQALTTRTLDQIAVPPLGTADLLADLPPPGEPGAAPYVRGAAATRPDPGWDVRTHVADPDPARAAGDALTDLENGATSLWLALGCGGIAVADLPVVLERVYVDLAPVALDCPEDPVGAAEAFLTLVEDRDVTPAAGTSVAVDPVSAALRTPDSAAATDLSVVRRLAGLAQRWPGTVACTVDGTALHDRHATDAQELGYTLAVGVALLRELADAGADVAAAAALLEFRFAATVEQLPTTAKLRAARRLWHRVLELSGAGDAPGQRQHAVTTRPGITKYDPWVNMLRGTVAAFAAGVGGAQAVTVLPFDSALGLPDALGRRIARNTSSLLLHESHVGVVTDPAGGAYAVERLTDELARTGWEEFQRVEAEGGIAASLSREDGLLGRVRERREERATRIAHRRLPLTGVSEFPHLSEVLPARRPLPDGAARVDRYGAAFEAMRDEPAATPVFLATMGPLAQHTARATFAANLLAAGGVDTVPAGPTTGVAAVVAAYRACDPPSPVACLAGADTAYAEWGAELASALKDAGAAYVVVAGKRRDLPVDDAAALGDDAVAFLTRIRQELAR